MATDRSLHLYVDGDNRGVVAPDFFIHYKSIMTNTIIEHVRTPITAMDNRHSNLVSKLVFYAQSTITTFTVIAGWK